MGREVKKASLGDVLRDNYLTYAKSTIIDRNIVHLDGFKNVQRRIIFDMYELKAFPRPRKSARIVGDTMGKFHPHGDSSIYGALCRMTDYAGYLNLPWIEANGCFGRSWSSSIIPPAAMRYTEAALTKQALDLCIDGLGENAVEMIDNFDETEKEPRMLPVKIPTVIINNSDGVATAISSSIPTYSLKSACKATIGMLQGKINSPEELAEALNAPDYTTGGTINMSMEQKVELCRGGRISGVYLTGSCNLSKNTISIYQLPYETTCEKVVQQIIDGIKSGTLSGITNVKNSTGKTGMLINVSVKNGYDINEAVKDLYRRTDLRMRISYNTRYVIWDAEKNDYDYKETGVYELLEKYWIPWRVDCIRRVYQFKIDKLLKQIHEKEAWELIEGHIKEFTDILSANKLSQAKILACKLYGLDDIQFTYLAEKKLRSITIDNMVDNLAQLAAAKVELAGYENIVNNDKAIKNIMVKENLDAISKYGADRKTLTGDLAIIQKDSEVKEVIISNENVWIGITANGMIKKARSYEDAYKMRSWVLPEDTFEQEIACSNDDTLLVFTGAGFCYKIPLDYIENVRGNFRDTIWKYVEKDDSDMSDIIKIDVAGDYSKWFNIIYADGKGRKVRYNHAVGKRSKYKNLYEPAYPNKNCKITNSDKFFIISTGNKAGYMDVSTMTIMNLSKARSQFKLPRIANGESFRGVVNEENVPDMSVIDLERYKRPYCVSMREDQLWGEKKEVDTESEPEEESTSEE